MKQIDMFDDGKARRDQGIETVLANTGAWRSKALAYIYSLPRGWMGTGEDIRLILTPRIGEPHDHNHAWGALIKVAIDHGYLIPTGRGHNAKSRKSNARWVKEYRRT